MKLEYLDGFDYDAVHQRARYVLDHTKRLKPSAEKELLQWFDQNCSTSKKTIDEAKSAIPGGVQHNLANNYPFALNCVKGEGAYLYDKQPDQSSVNLADIKTVHTQTNARCAR